MGWTDLPATQTTDWTSWAFRRQFALALHERQVACGLAELPTPAYAYEADWDAQGLAENAFGPGGLQSAVEALPSYYVRPIDYAGLAARPFFVHPVTGQPSFAYGRTAFWTDAGTPAGGIPSEDLDHAATAPGGFLARDGGRYAVRSPATGDWAGHAGEIAVAADDGEGGWDWDFETPADDTLVYVAGWNAYFRRDAGAGDWAATTRYGWTRKFPRSIERITDDGTEGDRARLAGPGSPLNAADTRFLGVRSAPPAFAVLGATYGVQDGATGAWAGHDGELATWSGSWSFADPDDGDEYLFHTRREAGGAWHIHRGAAAWVREGGGAWHRCGDLYDHDGDGWALSGDQASPPDVQTSTGPAEAGDYVGAWLFNELRAALDVLTVIGRVGGWGSGNDDGLEKQAGVYAQSTWALAKSAAEAAWSAGGDPSEGVAFDPVQVWTMGNWNFDAFGTRYHSRMEITFYPGDAAKDCTVKFWAIARTYDDEFAAFDGMGDPGVVQNSSWSWYETTAASQAAYSSMWQVARANAQPAPWPPEPDPDPEILGYQVSESETWATKDFGIAGGFVYQAD